MKRFTLLMMLVTLFSVTVLGQKGMKLQPIAKLHQKTLRVKGFDRQAQPANSKVTRRAPGDELVTPPSTATVETWYTASGYFFLYTDQGWSNYTSNMPTVNIAIDGTDLYIQGLAYWFKDAWIKGTIEGSTVTFANNQFIGTDEYGDEYMTGSVDGETIPESFAFNYDAEEGILTAEPQFIFENTSTTQLSPAAYWYISVFTKAEPAGPEVVVPPAGLVAEEYSMTYTPYEGEEASGSIKVGFDGNDVYFQGFCSFLPEAWIKGTLVDGVVTFAGNQYFGKYSIYDIFLQEADAVFTYEEATNSFYAEGLVYTYTGDQYADYYTDPIITKVEEQVGTPATPTIAGIQATQYGDVVVFNIPIVDTDGNGMVTDKLAYQFFVNDVNTPLEFTTKYFSKLTENMTVIPYVYTDNYDIYNDHIYLNMPHDTWDRLGIQSIYTGGGVENKSEIAWYDFPKPLVPPTGLVTEEYSMTYIPYEGEEASGSAPVKIGFDGNDVYLQGICSNLPEAWIKGTLADGVVTFAGNQYLGKLATYQFYFQENDAVFTYEAATQSFSLEGELYTYVGEQYADYYKNPVITKVTEKAATPATPTIAKVEDGSYGWYINFDIPTVDTNGEALLTSKLSYQIFVNDGSSVSALTFTPETHTRLTEPMTVIPYGFTEEYDFYPTAIYFNDLFSDAWDQVGIQSIYTGGGEEHKSEISWFTIVKPVVAPEGLATETYNFTASAVEAGHEEEGAEPYNIQVQVGFDGNDAYIQGLSPNAPELWVKATKNAEGQYVIPTNQYMGKLTYYTYTFPYYWTALDAEGNMIDAVFSFDSENSRFTTTQTQVLNGAADALDPYISFTEVVIEKMADVAATPADPTMEKVNFDVENDPGYNSLYCSVATVGTNEEVLNTSKLFYTIWIEKDGEQTPYTFTAALYPNDFEEDVVEIPYSYDGYDIYKGGEIIYIEDDLEELQTWSKVGIQSIYYGGDQCNKSNIIWLDNPVYTTGISSIAADKMQKSEGAWYTINGQRVAQPTQKGLYIHNGKKVVIK